MPLQPCRLTPDAKMQDTSRILHFCVAKSLFATLSIKACFDRRRICIGLRARLRRTLARLSCKIQGTCPWSLRILTLFSRLRAGKLCEAGLPKVLSPSVRGSLDSLNAGYEPYPAFAIFMEIFCEISVDKCIMLTEIAVYTVREPNWRFF